MLLWSDVNSATLLVFYYGLSRLNGIRVSLYNLIGWVWVLFLVAYSVFLVGAGLIVRARNACGDGGWGPGRSVTVCP